MTCWQDYQTFGPSNPAMKIPAEVADLPASAHLGALGMTGVTAYFGVTDVAEVKEGETVVISAASGAVGSVAGQIAKIVGARAVGIAGGAEKCAWLIDELGFDAAIDYKADDWAKQLKEATPDRIDVDFENVGGEIMEKVFGRLNIGARIALCGLISGYNDEGGPVGPRNFGALIAARAKLQGFLILDYLGRYGEAARQTRRVDAGRQDQAPRDGRRGPRAGAGAPQPPVRRRQDGQARRPRRRLTGGSAVRPAPPRAGTIQDSTAGVWC